MVLRRHYIYHTIRYNIHVRTLWTHDENSSHRKVVQNYTNGKNGENVEDSQGKKQTGEIFK